LKSASEIETLKSRSWKAALAPCKVAFNFYRATLMQSAVLKPNSITLAGSKLVRTWFNAGRRPASN